MKVLVDNANGRCALAITRSLGRKGIEVTAADETKNAISFFSKYCKHKLIYPSPEKHPDRFIQEMLRAVKSRKYDALFTLLGGDGMYLISKYRDKFTPFTNFPLVDHQTFCKANDKAQTLKTAIENNIPCPKTYFVENINDVRNIKDKLEYPVVIKPRISAGSKGLFYIASPNELISKYKQVSIEYENPLIQECIPYGGDAYGFEALFNKDSKPRAIFIHKRIREYPVTGGPSTLRESVYNPEIEKLGTRLLKAFNWYGVAMVEFKVDPRDGQAKLMEINPRFWGSLQLSIASGVDFPYLLYRMTMDGDIEPVLKYKLGVKCRWLFGDVKHLIDVMKGVPSGWGFKSPDRAKTLFNFLKFYEKDLSYDYISLDDPMIVIFDFLSPLIKRLL